jgi:hypothetical protein
VSKRRSRFVHQVRLTAVLGLAACQSSGEEEEGEVSGRVVRAGAPVEGASVAIDGRKSATTGADGRFEIVRVESGRHALTARLELASGAFVERTNEIDVEGETDAGDSLLPEEPVEIQPGEAGRTWVRLNWTASADPGFREYRVYRAYDSAFDLENAELLHVASVPDDVEYLDEGESEFGGLDPAETYYYRVHVLDDHGLLGGSKILAVTTREWDVDAFAVEYRLDEVEQFAGEAEVKGIAHVDECLWIVTLEPVGGYDDPDVTRLTCRDHTTGETLRQFKFDDEYIEPSGLAWNGSALWLNYCDRPGCEGTAKLGRIDPNTGEVTRTIVADFGTHDLAWDGQHLLLANIWNQIQVLDQDTGAIVDRLDVPFNNSSTRGVAWRPGEIWVDSHASDKLVVLDESGNHVGLVHGAPLDPRWNPPWDLHIEFVGDRLALVRNSRVHLFDIVPVDR